MPTLAEVTPLDTAFFEKAGVSPAEAASLVAQHEALAGRRGVEARADMGAALLETQPPPRPAAPQGFNLTTEQAVRAVHAHEQVQLQRELDATFAAPMSAFDYRLPEPPGGHTPESMKFTSELRTALHQEGIPALMVNSIGRSLASIAHGLARESPAEAAASDQASNARLRGLWGAEYHANLERVDRFIQNSSERSPTMRQFWERNSRALARDPLSIDWMLQLVKQRTAKS